MSTSLDGIKLFMETVLATKLWLHDSSLLPLPWQIRQERPRDKLKVAVMWNDGVVQPHPPITRALSEVTRKLEAAEGVEVVEWKPYKHDLGWELYVSYSTLHQTICMI